MMMTTAFGGFILLTAGFVLAIVAPEAAVVRDILGGVGALMMIFIGLRLLRR
jgi:hypothetical protein